MSALVLSAQRLAVLVPHHQHLLLPRRLSTTTDWLGLGRLRDIAFQNLMQDGLVQIDVFLALPELTARDVDYRSLLKLCTELAKWFKTQVNLVEYYIDGPGDMNSTRQPLKNITPIGGNGDSAPITIHLAVGRELIFAPRGNEPLFSRDGSHTGLNPGDSTMNGRTWSQLLSHMGLNCLKPFTSPDLAATDDTITQDLPAGLATALSYGFRLEGRETSPTELFVPTEENFMPKWTALPTSFA